MLSLIYKTQRHLYDWVQFETRRYSKVFVSDRFKNKTVLQDLPLCIVQAFTVGASFLMYFCESKMVYIVFKHGKT